MGHCLRRSPVHIRVRYFFLYSIFPQPENWKECCYLLWSDRFCYFLCERFIAGLPHISNLLIKSVRLNFLAALSSNKKSFQCLKSRNIFPLDIFLKAMAVSMVESVQPSTRSACRSHLSDWLIWPGLSSRLRPCYPIVTSMYINIQNIWRRYLLAPSPSPLFKNLWGYESASGGLHKILWI